MKAVVAIDSLKGSLSSMEQAMQSQKESTVRMPKPRWR